MATPSLQWDASAVSLKVVLPSGGKTTLQFTDALTDSNIEFPGEMIGASSTAAYLLTQANENLVNATNVGLLTTGVAYFTTSGGVATVSTKAIGTASGTIAAGDHTHSTYLTDAPSDGTLYGRLDGEWSAVTGGGSGGFENPMTTAGDIIVGGTSGAATRLGVGSEGQVIKVVSGTPAWTADTGAAVEVYSDTETAIGTWLGSTLYRKAIDIGSLPNAATKTVAHGISNIGTIVTQTGFMSNGTATTPLPYAPTSTVATDIKWFVSIYADATNVYVATSDNRTSFSGYIILTYTKTA